MGKGVKVHRWRISRKYVITAIGVLTLFYIGMYNILTEKTYTAFCQTSSCDENIIKFQQTNFVNKSEKKILLWTKYFTETWQFDSMTESKFNCPVTTNRSEIKTVDAVIFHYLDLWLWETVPGYRRPEQVWILYNMEAPPLQYFTGLPWTLLFNWTLTYRTDSTVPVPYGEFVSLNNAEKYVASIKYRNIDFSINKTKMVVAVISDCPDDARRYVYLQELGKYVTIDYYGKCGSLSCAFRNDSECESKEYRFRIAFENANCKDYVTEKFWKSLSQESIPIVNWKNVQSIEAPPKSYINIHDYNSAKELGSYLNLLASDSKLYNEYFAWKTNYKVKSYPIYKLCDALHTPKEAQTIIDPKNG